MSRRKQFSLDRSIGRGAVHGYSSSEGRTSFQELSHDGLQLLRLQANAWMAHEVEDAGEFFEFIDLEAPQRHGERGLTVRKNTRDFSTRVCASLGQAVRYDIASRPDEGEVSPEGLLPFGTSSVVIARAYPASVVLGTAVLIGIVVIALAPEPAARSVGA
jgi:hypothetical protein